MVDPIQARDAGKKRVALDLARSMTIAECAKAYIEAHGGMTKAAERAGLNRQQLYRTLSPEGNPELRSFARILNATGLQFIVTAKPTRGMRATSKRVVATA